MLNDEVNAARDVTKATNHRVHTFRARDFGLLGYVDADAVAFYRKPVRRCAPDTEFNLDGLSSLPRVDIVLSYVGADSALIEAAVAGGARGLVCAGFPSGHPTSMQMIALRRATKAGVIVIQASRADSGRVVQNSTGVRDNGLIAGDTLTASKARILLMLALTQTSEPAEIVRMFAPY